MAELFFKYKLFIYLAGISIVFVIVLFLFFTNEDDIQYTESIEVQSTVSATESEEEIVPNESEKEYIFVEVKGAVKFPDVYKLPKEARVKDALIRAEILKEADLKSVNQSAKLMDEMSIYVPLIGEEGIVTELTSSTTDLNKTLININTATKEELMNLNGIGEKKAETIITYREENGLFNKKEDIMNIPGIGEKTFENLEPYFEI